MLSILCGGLKFAKDARWRVEVAQSWRVVGGLRACYRVGMKLGLYLILVAVFLAGLACEGLLVTATPASGTQGPTPTATATAAATESDAISILRSTEENLGSASTFRLIVVNETSDGDLTIEAEVERPGRARVLSIAPSGEGQGAHMEYIYMGDAMYVLPPGFQAWIAVEDASEEVEALSRFPYVLGDLAADISGLEMVGDGVVEGESAYRLRGNAGEGLKRTSGLDGLRETPEVEMWVSRSTLLPLLVSVRTEGGGRPYEVSYFDYGSEISIRAPEETIDEDYFERLLEGSLGPEEMGRMVLALPVSGQHCIEGEIGKDVYREVIGGDSRDDLVVMLAFDACREVIFSGGFERP